MPHPLHRPTAMLVPPPLLYGGFFAAGWALHHAFTIPIISGNPSVLAWIGIVLFAAGLLLALGSVGLFRHAHTTLIPHGRATKLVTTGPYRITRNPMYVSLTIMFLGGTAIINSYWPLILLAIPLFILNQIVIPYEEMQLREIFPDYEAYATHVRRWI